MNTPIDIDKIGEWLDWLTIDCAPTTVAAYAWELRNLERWAQRVLDRPVLELKASDLARYLAERRALHNCSDATIRRSVNALRGFYRYALKRRSPAAALPIPKAKRKRQRTLTFAQAFLLLASLDTSTVKGKRDLALVCLALSTGLRESELCHLKKSEVDLLECRLTTRVKGGSDGDGVFGPDTAAALGTWLSVRDTLTGAETEMVFVSIGGATRGQPLTPSGLRVIFRRLGQAADLRDASGNPQKLSPHDFRRSFATLSHRAGAPSRIVQVAGRWGNLKMVEDYTSAITSADFAPYDPVGALMQFGPNGPRLNLNRSV